LQADLSGFYMADDYPAGLHRMGRAAGLVAAKGN